MKRGTEHNTIHKFCPPYFMCKWGGGWLTSFKKNEKDLKNDPRSERQISVTITEIIKEMHT